MAKVKDVMKGYHKKVPFPIDVDKIRKAGYDPHAYLRMLICELSKCSDSQEPTVQQVISAMADLQEEVDNPQNS